MNRFLTALVLCMLPAASQTSTNPNAKLLFKSGFESNTWMDPISSSADTKWPKLHGVDNSTGSDWDASLFGSNDGTTLLMVVGTGNPGIISDYMTARVEDVVGPYGTTTKALKAHILKDAPGTGVDQLVFERNLVTSDPKDIYIRMWVKLNPEISSQISHNGDWRTFFELKTYYDWRLITYLYRNSGGQLVWHSHADNGGDSYSGPVTWKWIRDVVADSAHPVPAGQWALFEYYLHRATDNTGRWLWAINGVLVADYTGPDTYGANRDGVKYFAYNNIYGTPPAIVGAYQWMDDFEVWDVPPCGSFPCGPAKSTGSADTQAPTAPSNLTATAVSSGEIDLSWSGSSDDVGVAGYRIYRDGGATPIASVTGTSYQNTGLAPSTTYSYSVVAFDAAGNTSPPGNIASATTGGSTAATCPGPATNAWTGCYYGTQDLTDLRLARTDPVVDFNWGTGSPGAPVPSDHFSARWSGIFTFNAGSYTFTLTADDGARVYIDNTLVPALSYWGDQPATTYTYTQAMTAGAHAITVEYYDNAVNAVAQMAWRQVSTPAPGSLTVNLTSPPDGTIVSRGTSVDLAVSVTGSVAKVQYRLDGVVIATANSVPWSAVWTASASGRRWRTLDAVATDTAGNTAISPGVRIRVR